MKTAFLVLAAVSACAETLSWSPSGDRLVHDIDGQLVVMDAYSLGETILGPGQLVPCVRAVGVFLHTTGLRPRRRFRSKHAPLRLGVVRP